MTIEELKAKRIKKIWDEVWCRTWWDIKERIEWDIDEETFLRAWYDYEGVFEQLGEEVFKNIKKITEKKEEVEND